MLIAIDARPLIKKRVGFGNLLFNTLMEILKIDSDNNYLLLSDREVWFPIESFSNVDVLYYKDSILYPKSFFYYLKLHVFLKKNGISPDVFWGTEHLMPKKLPEKTRKILTICDFTHIRYPNSTTKYNLLISKLFFLPSIRNADILACISENTRKELELLFNEEINDKIVSTIYLGGITKEKKAIKKDIYVSDNIKRVASDPFVLFIGTIEPRKDISLLIKVAPKLLGKVHVVVCGKIGWERHSVKKQLLHTENLSYIDYVTDSEKEYLLKRCFCLIQPSIYEGLGLPVIECMQSGSLVLVADNSALHEIVEMDELRFKTDNVDDLYYKLDALLSDRNLYLASKSYCKLRGSEFHWNKTAAEYYNIFMGK